jgi:hypothetical protein
LYYMLAACINLPCDMIAGASKTSKFVDRYSGPNPITPDLAHDSADHGWNVVELENGELKLIDSTWGSNGEIQIPGSANTVNFCFFSMSNDEFLLRHFPTVDNKMHLNLTFPPGVSKPDWSYLAQVNMQPVAANYPQWASVPEPPEILNTDKIDIIDGVTLEPRRKLINSFKQEIIWNTEAKKFQIASSPDIQVADIEVRVPADTPKDAVNPVTINAFVFKIQLACKHLRRTPGLFLKMKSVETFPVRPDIRYVVHEKYLLDNLVQKVMGRDGKEHKLISLQAQLPVHGLVDIVQWELA